MSGITTPTSEPVRTLEVLNTLDQSEIVEGYRDGLAGEPTPGGNRSLSYWHGWRNGMVDSGRMQKDIAMAELARAVVRSWARA